MVVSPHKSIANIKEIEGRVWKSRKTYHQPKLATLGDLRTITLGGTIGTGDSGCAGVEKPWDGIPSHLHPCP